METTEDMDTTPVMDTIPVIETTADMKTYLKKYGLIIKRNEQEIDKTMKHITYSIIEEGTNTEEASLQLFLCNKDLDNSKAKLPKEPKKQINELKKILDLKYCSIAWVNGSIRYKNLGKFIIYYMLLDCIEKYQLFITKLDNASGSSDTYRKFGFIPVEEGGEEEIMISPVFEQLRKELSENIFIEERKKKDKWLRTRALIRIKTMIMRKKRKKVDAEEEEEEEDAEEEEEGKEGEGEEEEEEEEGKE